MTAEEKNGLIRRINSVEENDKARFGRMNVNQMICHCADQLRMALGEIEGLHYEDVNMDKLREMMARGESLPTVDGLDQAEGQGTKPTTLEDDKIILIGYIDKFNRADENYRFHFHPFIGEMDKEKWDRLVIHHLNHHLMQFNR